MTNLEVDVMDGDEFVVHGALVWQKRNERAGLMARLIEIGQVNDFHPAIGSSHAMPIDLPTFTRYCEGCGLTVKQVKPEPKVETIKPPEFWLEWKDGGYTSQKDLPSAEAKKKTFGETVIRIVRIDWGAK